MILGVESRQAKLDLGFLRMWVKLVSLSHCDKNFKSYTDVATMTHPRREDLMCFHVAEAFRLIQGDLRKHGRTLEIWGVHTQSTGSVSSPPGPVEPECGPGPHKTLANYCWEVSVPQMWAALYLWQMPSSHA